MTQETTKLPLLTSWVSLLLLCFLSVRGPQFLRLCWSSREITSVYLHRASISLYGIYMLCLSLCGPSSMCASHPDGKKWTVDVQRGQIQLISAHFLWLCSDATYQHHTEALWVIVEVQQSMTKAQKVLAHNNMYHKLLPSLTTRQCHKLLPQRSRNHAKTETKTNTNSINDHRLFKQ